MTEFRTLSLDDIRDQKKGLGLLVLDESAITCQRLLGLKEKVEDMGDRVVLMMPEEQCQKGLRGWAKAQILIAYAGLAGVMPIAAAEMQRELSTGWKTVAIPDPIVLETKQMIIPAGEEKPVKIDFTVTESEEDVRWIKHAQGLVAGSNCWYDPAGCVFVNKGKMLVEGVSTSLNQSRCRRIPIDFRELSLNPGERMMFCDAQHAERVGVSKAAREGISLEGSTLYVSKFPCRPCIQNILGAGIRQVIFEKESYGIPEAQLLLDNGVKIKRVRLEN
jgi:dCMP deaminase